MTPNTTRRSDYWVLAITLLATMPYENGPMATIIPPTWKPYVAAAGIIAKMFLDEMKIRQTANKEDL
jgi:hypothetical protein